MTNFLSSQVDTAKSQAFWDTSRLQKLKSNSSSRENMRSTAEEFSALMLQMVIKSMRKAEGHLKSELFASDSFKQYEDMMDQQWALHMAKSQGNPLVNSVLQEFTKNQGAEINAKHTRVSAVTAAAVQSTGSHDIAVALQSPGQSIIAKNAVAQQLPQETPKQSQFTGRQDFIDKLLPAAVAAAKTIGVDPKLLIAQAALETGWGAKIAKLPDGQCSHNLFGIKSSADWQGSKVTTKTTEFTNGILQRKTDSFRAYKGFDESINDYVNLIGGSARYYHSRSQVHTPELYTKALQDAGYATDPKYAEKIMQIYKDL